MPFEQSNKLLLTRYQIPLLSCRNWDGTVIDASWRCLGDLGSPATAWFRIEKPAGGAAGMGGWGDGDLELRGDSADLPSFANNILQFEFCLPPEYRAGGTVRVVVAAKYTHDTQDPAVRTIDCEPYKLSDAGVGASLGSFSAETLTTSYADYTFSLTTTSLVPGDRLLILIQTWLSADTADSWSCIGAIEVQADGEY